MQKYYLDTCIWRDFYQNRFSRTGRPLGKYASDLIIKILKKKNQIIFSDFIVTELRLNYSITEINQMFDILFMIGKLRRVETPAELFEEAKLIALKRDVAKGDALHALLAKDNGSIMVSQDMHFQKLKDIVEVKKPEEIT